MAQVTDLKTISAGMVVKELAACNELVFRFKAKREDTIQPFIEYIYHDWFPQSTCQLQESACYAFAKYEKWVDKDGQSVIEYWVPII